MNACNKINNKIKVATIFMMVATLFNRKDENMLNKETTLINLKSSNDSLLLNKLDLLIFSQPAEILEEVNR